RPKLPASDDRFGLPTMKISGPGSASPTRAAKPAPPRGGGEGFGVAPAAPPAATAAAQGVTASAGVMGVEALIALQDVGSPLERRRRSVARAGRILDMLEGIKVARIGGELTEADLSRLARAVREERATTDDPK